MIRTARLAGLPLAESDVADLDALHREPEVVAAFGAAPLTADETKEFLARKLAHWRAHGFGIWMFRDGEGKFVGRCGIHRWRDHEVELGYIVKYDLWGRGYATEMAASVADHAVTTLGLRDLVAFTRQSNAASRRVMEKVGFVWERDFIEEGVPSVLCRLRAS